MEPTTISPETTKEEFLNTLEIGETTPLHSIKEFWPTENDATVVDDIFDMGNTYKRLAWFNDPDHDFEDGYGYETDEMVMLVVTNDNHVFGLSRNENYFDITPDTPFTYLGELDK